MIHIPLTAHHVRFTVQAETTITFNDFAGSALRGAFASTLRRAYCPEAYRRTVDPLHKAICPACQLLDAEADSQTNGDVRRPYAMRPPLEAKRVYAAGEPLTFEMTLFGDKLTYFPYLVLTVQRMGVEAGIGGRNSDGERGRFSLHRMDAVNPLSGDVQPLLAPGDKSVRMPAIPVTHGQVVQAAQRWADALAARNNCLRIHLRTPVRLIRNGQRVETPEFFTLAKQVVLRVIDLSAQHAGVRPDVQLKRDIYPYADLVAVVEDATEWWDVKGFSGRLGREQVMGGLIGTATYYAQEWRPLLPWLIWGQSTGVGKNIVKGCGIYELEVN